MREKDSCVHFDWEDKNTENNLCPLLIFTEVPWSIDSICCLNDSTFTIHTACSLYFSQLGSGGMVFAPLDLDQLVLKI